MRAAYRADSKGWEHVFFASSLICNNVPWHEDKVQAKGLMSLPAN